ncbi:MAG TPA: tetratricopeptide repeat protein [Chitinophagaceae bacterium]|nr:tetratricopeptide repeat protein [Chitinophagaceae bacterium]
MDRIEKLREFLEASPHDSFLQHALALEYVKVGDDERARALFESILQRDRGYTGTYYHLAKLLERQGEREAAIRVYEEGMEETRKKGDRHAYSELQNAYEELTER